MHYVWYEYPKQGKKANFYGVLELLNKAKIPEDETEMSELDELMYCLPENHPALITYKKVRIGATDTVRSIIISANSRLAYLQNPKILRILDHDDMDIPAMGEGVYENPKRRTALFCVIPDNDKSYNFVVGLLYTQIFQELYYIADHKYDGSLPVPVALWMDEFPNVALPDGFLEILATCRSREISCNIIIQNLAQLKTLFKDSWETIPGNCDVLIYLGGNEVGTHKYISELLGKWTIDKRSSGETLGSHGSSSRNYDVLGRELLTPDEVRKLDNRKCLIFVRGFDPVLDDKYRTFAKEEFQQASALGPYLHKKEWAVMLEEGRDQFYLGGEKEESYYYQVESYKGIFEESETFRDLQSMGNYFILPGRDGYLHNDMEVYPIFSTEGERIKTGVGSLSRHLIVGYFTDMEGYIIVEAELIEKIFRTSNRVNDIRRSFM